MSWDSIGKLAAIVGITAVGVTVLVAVGVIAWMVIDEARRTR